MPPNSLRFGDWELKGHLGKGGFGEVKHWKNRKTNQEIGMQVIYIYQYVLRKIFL